jgi:single-strand DNA-binding protein
MFLNRVFLLGNVVNDPEARMTPSGIPVVNFRLATNRVFKDRSGQKQEQTEFHNIVMWGRQAEIAREYLKRGRLLFIEGRLQTRSWNAPDGQKRWRTEIIAERFQLGPKATMTTESHPATGSEPAKTDAQPSEIPVIEEDEPLTFEDEEPKEVDPKEIPF